MDLPKPTTQNLIFKNSSFKNIHHRLQACASGSAGAINFTHYFLFSKLSSSKLCPLSNILSFLLNIPYLKPLDKISANTQNLSPNNYPPQAASLCLRLRRSLFPLLPSPSFQSSLRFSKHQSYALQSLPTFILLQLHLFNPLSKQLDKISQTTLNISIPP